MGGAGSGRHPNPLNYLLPQQQQQPEFQQDNMTYMAGRGLKTGTVAGQDFGSGTSGGVIFATSQGNLQADQSNFFWDETNNRLGLGTNAPTALLEINKNAIDTAFRITRSPTSYITFSIPSGTPGFMQITGTGTQMMQLFTTASGNYGTGDFALTNSTSPPNPALFYDNSTNRIGMNTNIPTVPLEVSGAATISGGYFRVEDAVASPRIIVSGAAQPQYFVGASGGITATITAASFGVNTMLFSGGLLVGYG